MCAIAGAFNVQNASWVVSKMLLAMQHRGQDGAGITSVSGTRLLASVSGFGLVDEVFRDVDFTHSLPGFCAVGQVRYPTSGDKHSRNNLQPIVVRRQSGDLALVHNGNLTNAPKLRKGFERNGAIIHSSSDSELILHAMAHFGNRDIVAQIEAACERVEGAYSTLILSPNGLFATVDPLGFRPLSMARFGDGFLFASETCAFDLFEGVSDVQSVLPGTIVAVRPGEEPRVCRYASAPWTRQCSFEHIYFARPDSEVFGVSVHAMRERLGAALGRRNTIAADLVIAVPDSSNIHALAFANAAGIPFGFGLIRNHYTGRTFISPTQKARKLGVRMKLNAVKSVVAGARIIVVDDSIVRSNTARKVQRILREAGAREVHMVVASPPVTHPCHWGIDTPERRHLIAAQIPLTDLATHLGLDSLTYLTHPELLEALGDTPGQRYCTSCFTGKKPAVCSRAV